MRTLKPASIVVALGIFLLSAGLIWLCTGHANPEAYLFPLMISITLFLLSGFLFAREILGLYRSDLQAVPLLKLLPALLIFIAYANAIETVGMYTSSMLVLLALSLLYHPTTNGFRRVRSSVLLAGGFTAAMYVLFAILLNVQTPRGWFI